MRPFLDAGGYGEPVPTASTNGPRQEYLDAFDGPRGETFATGAPGRRSPAPPAGSASGPPGPPPPPHARGVAAESLGPQPPQPGDAAVEAAEEPGPLAPIAPPRRRSSRGRMVTGLVAAAVTAVLAVTVAGQVPEDEAAGGGQDPAGVEHRDDTQGGTAAGSEEHAAGTEQAGGARDARPRTYAQKMAAPYALPANFVGDGGFETVAGHEKGVHAASVLRYRVDVEKGLPLDGEFFARAVHKTLNDERSWAHDGARGFERVSSGDADFVITLASPQTTDVWCAKSGLDTSEQKVSCDSAATERVMINGYRWARGARTYGDEHLWSYRQMLINHEVGHRLGHGHLGCTHNGALAPVMMQQTKFLTTDGVTCRRNAWPYPRG